MEWNVEIAFCKESDPALSYLTSQLQEIFLEREVPSHFEIYETSEELQAAIDFGKRFDICFLNVDRGFGPAEQIVQKFPHIFLIFTAEREDLIYTSMRYHPYSFLRELRLEEDSGWVFQALGDYFQEHRGPFCEVRDVTGNPYSIALEKIIYLAAEDKYVNIVTQEGGFYVRNTLSNLEKSLEFYGVVRIHRSFLVNIQAVEMVKYGKVILKNGQQLPLGRSRASEVRGKIAVYRRHNR